MLLGFAIGVLALRLMLVFICLRSLAVSQPNSSRERPASELIPQIDRDQRTQDGFGYRCRGPGMNPADRSADLVNPRGRRSAL